MAAEAAPDTALEGRVREEQIALLFRHTPLSLLTNVLLASGLVWILWEVADQFVLKVWWLFIVVLAAVRGVFFLGYRHRSPHHPLPWHSFMSAVTLASGGVWGAAGVLFFIPDATIALIFVSLVIGGLTAGAVPAYVSWPPALYSLVPTCLPLALRYLVEGGEFTVMGFMCLLYMVNVLSGGRSLSKVLVGSIRLRLERQELVHQLQEGKAFAERAREKAEEANAAKSKFLAAASHDLRQPLQAVNLFVEAIRHERDPAQAGKLLDDLGASVHALEGLFNEILDISKLEAGLFRPQPGVIVVQALFNGLERELGPVAEEKGIELGFVPTRLKVMSDAPMLVRILRNIILNAIHYTPEGAVLVGCRRKGHCVALTVYDTGPGIAPEHQRAIFREFYQIGNAERDRRKGLGLGLAIVDGLCRVLDHRLELHSRPGQGSTFSVYVPVTGDAAPERPVATVAVSGLAGRAVLVIDDESTIREAASTVLRQWGCPVLTAGSADDAITQMNETGFMPDALIADYRLRDGQTGTEAIAAVRGALGRPVPAAILTGDTAPERLREASASGLLLLHKPLHPARLRAALIHLCGAPSPGQPFEAADDAG